MEGWNEGQARSRTGGRGGVGRDQGVADCWDGRVGKDDAEGGRVGGQEGRQGEQVESRLCQRKAFNEGLAHERAQYESVGE